jgi:predicted GNAT family N-acyltransferase
MGHRIIITNEQQEREKAYIIRRKVFVEEQHVPDEMEIDEVDERADTQYILIMNEEEKPVGTARFRPYGEGVLKVERVAVLKEQRGTGTGRMIMETIETTAKKAGYQGLKLAAQLHARKFYEGLGYQSQGETYLEAGIEHIDMVKSI